MPLWDLPPQLSAWVVQLALVLDARVHHRLTALVVGLLFARGRRTVTSWLRGAGIGAAFRTKLGQAADLLRWLVRWLAWLGKPIWLEPVMNFPRTRAGARARGRRPSASRPGWRRAARSRGPAGGTAPPRRMSAPPPSGAAAARTRAWPRRA